MKHNLKTVVAKISFPEECVDCLETRMEIDKLVKELQQLKQHLIENHLEIANVPMVIDEILGVEQQ